MSDITETIATAPQSAAPALSELEQMTNAYVEATGTIQRVIRSRDGFKALLADTEKTLEATRKELHDLRLEPNPMIAKLEAEVQTLRTELATVQAEATADDEKACSDYNGIQAENTRLLARITELESTARPSVCDEEAAQMMRSAPAKRGPGRPPKTQ